MGFFSFVSWSSATLGASILLAVAVILILSGWLCKVIYDIYVFLLAPYFGLSTDLIKSGGKWAAVTGAGAGIGRGYSLALARRGVNVCLIGRSEKSLAAVAKICEEKFNVKTKIVVHDFAKIEANDGEVMKEALKDILAEIGILINNVGIMGGEENFTIPFVNNKPNPVDYGRNMVNVNIQSVILMTGLLLPLFVQRNKGIIVNVSSSCGIRPFFGHAVYSSTKSFMDFFAEALRQECKQLRAAKVLIQTVFPFFVRTALVPTVAYETFPSILQPDPESFTEAAVDSIGLQQKTSGCFSHNVQLRFIQLLGILLPKSAVDWIQNQMSLSIRKMIDKYNSKQK